MIRVVHHNSHSSGPLDVMPRVIESGSARSGGGVEIFLSNISFFLIVVTQDHHISHCCPGKLGIHLSCLLIDYDQILQPTLVLILI